MKQEDSEKLEQLYKLYEQPMYRIAYAVLHHEMAAEDAVSDAFVRVVRHLHQIENPDSPEARSYMIKVIRSTAFSIYRKRKKQLEREVPMEDSVLQVADPSAKIECSSVSETEQMLRALEAQDRELILLRCEQELPWSEVARRLHISESCARKRFERLRKTMSERKRAL